MSCDDLIMIEFSGRQFNQFPFQQLALARLVRQPLEFLERQQGRGRAHESMLYRAIWAGGDGTSACDRSADMLVPAAGRSELKTVRLHFPASVRLLFPNGYVFAVVGRGTSRHA